MQLSFNTKKKCLSNTKSIPNKNASQLNKNNLSFPVAVTTNDLKTMIIKPRAKNKPIHKHTTKSTNIFINNITVQIPPTNKHSFHDTLKYFYEYLMIGIYVKIYKNKVELYIPIFNHQYENKWHTFITSYYPQNVVKKWSTNNCLLGDTKEQYISNTRLVEFKDMLDHVCDNRKINDCEFFMNKRDFPVLRKDKRHPYFHLFPNDNIPLSIPDKQYLSILSVCSNDDYNDILMPTEDDWYYATKKVFINYCNDSYTKDKLKNINREWDTKKPIAMFRGKATGCGISTYTNQRLKLAYLSNRWKKNNPIILDAGVTKWNRRLKIYHGKIGKIKPKRIPFKLAKYVSREEQSNYKYLINVDGHSAAFRLGYELSTMSVVLKVHSPDKYKIWYSHLLEPYVHYIPIKQDLSNLKEQIMWCIDNDDKCKNIATNAYTFYKKYLNTEGIYDYMEVILNSITQ